MSSSTGGESTARRALFGRTHQTAAAGQEAEHVQSQLELTRDEQAVEHAQALDEVLDDIETSLKGNAEEYVSGFVQQGGQ